MNRLFFLGFLLTVIASIFWGAMGTAVQHLFLVKSGFSALGLVTLRQLSAGLLFVAIGTLVMPRKMWSVFSDRKLLFEIVVSGVLVFLAHFCFFRSIFYSNAGTAAIFLTLNACSLSRSPNVCCRVGLHGACRLGRDADGHRR